MNIAAGKYLLIYILSLISWTHSFGQVKEYSLLILSPVDSPLNKKIDRIEERTYMDTVELYRAMNGLLDRFYNEGYLSAGFDSIIRSGSDYIAYLEPGIQYKWGKIGFRTEALSGVKANEKPFLQKAGKILTVKQINNIRSGVISRYENEGYPFVKVRLDSISFDGGVLNADLIIDPGAFIIIDSLVIRSDEIISRRVLQQITGIKTGQPYNEKKIIWAGRQLDNSEFIKSALPVEVGFMDGKAWVYISPDKKRSNTFDGVLGLVPASANSNGISFTGSVDLKLNNTLKQAESFYVKWKSPSNRNQRLQTGLDLPYFVGWPVGLYADLELFKKDTSYLNTEWSAGLLAALSYSNRVGFYVKRKSSNILSTDSPGYYQDLDANVYGIKWTVNMLDNILNPARGYMVNSDIGVGNKKNPVEQDEPNSVYWEGRGDVMVFMPVSNKLVVKIGSKAGFISGREVYRNEKYRLGGLNSLRGFDEESILADSFITGTAEFRYLFNRNSNFHIFADAGRWWSMQEGLSLSDIPVGFGLGVSLETKAGVILLDYALGISQDQSLNIRNGKIHLGLKSLF